MSRRWGALLAAFGAAGAASLAGVAVTVASTVGQPQASASGELDAVLGRALFRRDWVTAGASTDSADGLGPLFSARSCAGCHAGDALGARFTDVGGGQLAGRGLVIRFGDRDGRPDPVYGALLQTAATAGLQAEGRVALAATPGGGLTASTNLQRGALAPGVTVEARIAPPLAGRAALERIDPAAVLALADPDDRDGDGISGRVRLVATPAGPALGRFGWKAGAADLQTQVADAFAREMGLSSARRPLPHGDCTTGEPDCLAAATGIVRASAGAPPAHELEPEIVGLVATFLRAAPPPRGRSAAAPPAFAAAGCDGCHVPAMPALGGGNVDSYTDLLLHDMGPALDGGVGEAGAKPAEWRTAPLLALGTDDGRRRYLHDGRAPDLDAAIRAHDGEAARAASAYAALGDAQRQALLTFLGSL